MARKISDSDRKRIIKDIQGEFDCFRECFDRLNGNDTVLNEEKSGKIQEPYRRICLDCFLLHARNLYDFLYIEPRFKDDVSANDFYLGLSKLIEDVPADRINKQLSHITYNRLTNQQRDLFSEKEKIYRAIRKALIYYNKKVEKCYRIKL